MKFFAVLFIFFFSIFHANSQAVSSLKALDSLYTLAGIKISSEIQGINSINLQLEGHASKWMMEKSLSKSLLLNKIVLAADSIKADGILKVYITDAGAGYEIINDDLLKRTVRIKGDAILSGKISKYFEIDQSIQDTVPESEAKELEADYPFTKAKIPEKPLGFFEKYMEPAIITAAAVVTAILLFSVRSGAQ